MTNNNRLLIRMLSNPGSSASNPCQAARHNRHYHYGRVTSVDGNLVYVALDGSDIANAYNYSALYSPTPGDFVVVDHERDTWFVTHPVAT